MKRKVFLVVAVAATGMMVASCGGTKQVAQGYQQPAQTQPKTLEQAQAANRGMKQEKEECEEEALKPTDNLREAGNGISDKEAFATNLALLDARAKLAQQLEVLINGLMRNFDQQHEAEKGFTRVGKASGVQQGYFEQLLTNTRPICKNTYVKEDGKYNVYVCVEMGEQQKKAVVQKLKDDKILEIDARESLILDDLNKAKEAYRQKLAGE
ncbi:MAG: LPP20 family lipoprotein [Prevotellaceae bacterium]|jgi:hypothetical protein|nr:LPP20 family lipoprotein [Prevotellaceae bacterium]